MSEGVEMSKYRLSVLCCCSTKTIQNRCNKTFFDDLSKLGYYRTQKLFTPAQWQFLTTKMVVVPD